MDRNLTSRNRELQAHTFSQGHFLTQRGGNAGLADVDRVSANDLNVARIDADLDL